MAKNRIFEKSPKSNFFGPQIFLTTVKFSQKGTILRGWHHPQMKEKFYIQQKLIALNKFTAFVYKII